jgi:hypothetical protein
MYKVKNNHMIGHALNASSTWRWRQMPRSQRIDQQRKRVLEVFLTKGDGKLPGDIVWIYVNKHRRS